MFGSMSTEEMEAGGTDDFWKAAIGQDINSLPKQQQDQLRDFVRKRGGNYRGKNSGFLLNLVGDQKIISNIKRLGGGGDLRSSMQNLRQNKGALATLSKEDREAAIAYMAQADFAPTQVVGGTTEEFGKGAGMHWGTVAKGAPPPAGSSGQQTSDNSATRVNEGQAKAAADLFARWGDPKNAAAIDAAAAASGQLILQLNKLGNPNVIGNPTQVLQQTAAAMKALADNAGNLSAALNRLNASSLHIQ
jgi:hypothetical protein